jgi:hypothetical protein
VGFADVYFLAEFRNEAFELKSVVEGVESVVALTVLFSGEEGWSLAR